MYSCSLKVYFQRMFNASFFPLLNSFLLKFFFPCGSVFPISLGKSGKVIDSLLYVNPMAFLANCY